METAIGQERGLRGGSYEDYDLLLEAAYQDAQKPASELAMDGTADSPAATVSITVTGYPVPVQASLAPASVTAGAAGFTLTVNGSGFIAPAVKPVLKVTATVARTSRGYLVALKIGNTGTTAVTVVRLTSAPWGEIAPSTELPRSYGTIKPGRSVQKTLTFSNRVEAHGQTKTLVVKVTYSGGELSQSISLKLP